MMSSSFGVQEKLFGSFSRNADVSAGFASLFQLYFLRLTGLPFVALRLTLKVTVRMRWSKSSSTLLYVL